MLRLFGTPPQLTPQREQQLVQQCISGGVAHFGPLYDHYMPRVYGFIVLRTRSREVAEDITSATFERALQYLPSYVPSATGMMPWLLQIARNLLADHYRREGNAPTTMLEDDDDPRLVSSERLADEAAARIDAAALLDYVRQHCGSRDAELLQLRIWQGMPWADVATHVGMTEGAAKVAYGRLIARLAPLFAS